MQKDHRINNEKRVMCIALVGLTILVIGCSKGKNIPDVDHIVPEFELVRSEQYLATIDSLTPDRQIDEMLEKHPAFWDLFFKNILPLSDVTGSDTNRFNQIRAIAGDSRIRSIIDSVNTRYPDFDLYNAQLYEAFQFFEYYFPGNKAPDVYTLISDFGFFPFIFQESAQKDGIGISLEMFLDKDFPYAGVAGNHPVFSEYLIRTYNDEHLVKKSLDVIIDDIIGPPPGDRLIDLMLHNGKKLYITELLLPEHPDTVWFEFTPNQLTWCRDNERNLWAHFLTEDLLYSNEYGKINKLVNYSPTVPGMPPETPGRVANWTGYRIILEIIERNPKMTLLDLIALRDAQFLLELARYRPK